MSNEIENPTPPVHVRCLNSCRQILTQIKAALLSELREVIALHGEIIRAAINEAEALACGTEFPHLFFPTLAMEKVQAVAKSNQGLVRR
ncbi:hypothetical protein [Pedosphaera parvula]|uniref:Uncharacterized protein n=1 Tax=Pedosphaera parvula (strain Ellin514) TaxID=320771 RepID=B9XMU5_PEDPL|nr:hypothetical protein [Pedosphaera parvula]EEF58870.1 hypothetical protein Cflav_PD1703 [Pedosphaera parvula Ellin514]